MPGVAGPRGRGAWPEAFGRLHPLAVGAAALAMAAASPLLWSVQPEALAVAATALILLGVPHGAVDHRVARPLLRRRLGRAWFVGFTATYLGAAGLVLAGWWLAPVASLGVFLAISVWHFGLEDAEGRGIVARLARGGMPVALPVLIHPERTERFFEVLATTELAIVGATTLAWAWLPLLALHAAGILGRGAWREGVEVGALLLIFAASPPLAAFAFYFLVVHSPRHAAELAGRHDPGDARRGWGWTLRRSLPLSVATAAMGAALFWGLDGTTEERLLRTVFWGLAALTVPHVALHHLDRRWGGARLA